jgi:head-tail adaptor
LIRRNETYNPSRLRFRAQLQIELGTRDDIGGFTTEWRTALTRFCDIVPISSGESLRVGQIVGDVTHRVHMRVLSQTEAIYANAILAGYDSVSPEHDLATISAQTSTLSSLLTPFTASGLGEIDSINPQERETVDAPRYRLIYKGRTLHITGIRQLGERREWLELTCREET